MTHRPTSDREWELRSRGYGLIAGVDEVGRGCIAGPVFAAAVILPLEIDLPWLAQVRDSKELSPQQRERLFVKIEASPAIIGIGMVHHSDIDERGIVRATQTAMAMAVEQLEKTPDFVLVDAIPLPEVSLPQRSIVHGDQLCHSIACASIVAKVSRDRYMKELDKVYPGYGLARHKGYPTKHHLLMLQRLGLSPIHRRSFAPVRRLIVHGPQGIGRSG
ncbi:MAG: ribonuclease HII [Chloroflexi bacterium]|nr:ribonuclease HII [Chloroflexota bacterium]